MDLTDAEREFDLTDAPRNLNLTDASRNLDLTDAERKLDHTDAPRYLGRPMQNVKKKLTARGVPKRSPIQVLTAPDAAWLQCSDENWQFQRGMAVNNKYSDIFYDISLFGSGKDVNVFTYKK